MKINAPLNRLEYIRQLNIDILSNPDFVVCGSILSHSYSEPSIHIDDVNFSLLLAQLAANKKINRNESANEWFNFFIETLQNLGWNTTNTNWETYSVTRKNIYLNNVVQERFEVNGSGTEANQINEVLKIFKEQPDDSESVEVFFQQSSSCNSSNFLIGSVSTNINNESNLLLGAFNLIYSQAIERRFLFLPLRSTNINIYTAMTRMTLNNEIYKTIRESVREKLGKHIQEDIWLLN